MIRWLTQSKKRTLAVLGGVAVLAMAVAAVAYFTSTGSGTGSATVGSASGTQLSSPTVSTLYPGGADVPVTVSIHNPGSGAERVGTISGTVADNGTCLGAWFHVDSITYNQTVAPAATTTAATNVRMLDSGTNQDPCQGQAMTINWSSN
jgi:hypothetical protein